MWFVARFHGISTIVREEGLARLWRGVGPTVTRAMLVTGSQIPTYEVCSQPRWRVRFEGDGSGKRGEWGVEGRS